MRILSWVTRACLIIGIAIGTPASLVGAPAATLDIPRTDTQKPLSSREQFKLGIAYLMGDRVQQNDGLGAFWLEKAAASGDPQAENDLGYLYQIGMGVPVDHERAVHWYRLASSAGLPIAKVNLGVMYFWGTGTPKDTSVAEQLFREALKKKIGIAAAYLGNMYYSGLGVNVDRDKARQFYETGAKLHDPVADYNLANFYLLTVDRSKAASLFRDSIASGYTPAMYSLGSLLAKHAELAKSPGEARKLLEESAEAGIWQSSAALGVLSRDGMNTSVDKEAAYRYFREAALKGGERAMKVVGHDLDGLSQGLGVPTTSKLDVEANAWLKEHSKTLQYVGRENRKQGVLTFSLTTPVPGAHAGALIPASPVGDASAEPM